MSLEITSVEAPLGIVYMCNDTLSNDAREHLSQNICQRTKYYQGKKIFNLDWSKRKLPDITKLAEWVRYWWNRGAVITSRYIIRTISSFIMVLNSFESVIVQFITKYWSILGAEDTDAVLVWSGKMAWKRIDSFDQHIVDNK